MHVKSIESIPRKTKNRFLKSRRPPPLPILSNENVSCRENFVQYLQNSTLHGLKYVGDGEISWFERIFFVLAFCLVFFLSVYFISNVWIKWSASPVIITLNSMATSITEFPFPAITICNMNQARKSAVKNIPRSTTEDSFLQNLCLNQVDANGSSAEKWPRFKKFMENVSQPCSEMLLMCRYGGEDFNCLKLFNTILTDEGLCCNFNGVHPRFLKKNFNDTLEFNTSDAAANDWTPERSFPSMNYEENKRSYPRPAVGTGSRLGLFIALYANLKEYYCSSTSSYGFKLLLHSPIESPKIAHFGMALSIGYETQMLVTPVISQASNRIRRVPTAVRQCLFENETDLSYYRTYTRRNCEMECEAKIYAEHCKCILYYLPNIRDDINICGGYERQCVQNVQSLIESKTNSSFMCQCLPSCYAISYDADMSAAPILTQANNSRVKYRSDVLKSHDVKDLAILHVFFKETHFRSQIKEELIGFTEFLSNTGGLLGLFMGFSVVSIVELFYYVFFRPYCAQQRIDNESKFYQNGVFMSTPELKKSMTQSFVSSIKRFVCRALVRIMSVLPVHDNRTNYPYID